MNFAKIKSGIAPLDERFEGLYISQPALLSGKRGSGTSTIAIRFLSHLVRIGEKVLLFTDQPPAHVGFSALGLGPDITPAIESEQLSIVPYDQQLPLLPFPEALDELRNLVAESHYTYVVFDPVTPWLAAPADALDKRLQSFFSVLSETSATSLLVLHKPVSKLARRLFDAVAERCTVCLSAVRSTDGTHTLQVDKYMGEPPEKCPAILQLATPSQPVSPVDIFNSEMGSFGTARSTHTPPRAAPQPSASASASFFSLPNRPQQSAPAAFPAPTAAFPAPSAPKAPQGMPRPTPPPQQPIRPPQPPQLARPQQPPQPSQPVRPQQPQQPPQPPQPPPSARPQQPAQKPAPGGNGDIPFSRILNDEPSLFPTPAPRNEPQPPAPPRSIHFADASPAAVRPQDAPPPQPPPQQPQQPPPPPSRQPQQPPQLSFRDATPPAEAPPPQEPHIRFSDIIQ